MLSALNLEIFLIGLVVVANIVLGSIIFFHNRKSATGLLFFIFTLVSSFWSILNYFSYYLLDPLFTLWTMRLVMFFAIYQAFFFFLLMHTFPGLNFKFNKLIKYGIIPLVIFVSVLTFTPFVFSDVKIIAGRSPEPEVRPGIILFALVAVPLVIGGIVTMLVKLKKADSKSKPQFKLLLGGLFLMFFLIILFNFVFAIVLKIANFIPFGAVFIFPFIFATFYAIYKHEFLNARIVATEIFTFLIMVLTFIEIIVSRSLIEIVLRSGVFVLLLTFGVMFIKASIRELEQREKLEELMQRLKVLDAQKDEFISMAAHELRAPMTAIKGYISMILEGDTGEISQKARGYLADANSINDRLIRLVNNMLNVSRIEAGKMVFQFETEELSHVVRAVYSSFIPEANRKGLKYTLDIKRSIKDKVSVDVDNLHEVIANLISNAVKYTDEGSVQIRLVQPKSGWVRFEIEDTGPGISEREQKKLFQKFYRIETNFGKTTGTGLGLYISRLLVEKFGGKIGVKSQLGKGSVFWFELPLVK